ncbi:MAG: Gfo/Idh/MocA family oxidoreductase [Pseudomonadota bacterium]
MSFRAGLIGYGFGGRVFHAPLLEAAGIELAAIGSSRLDDIRRDHPSATPYADYHDLLADQSLDLVIVCTPSPTHGSVAIEALDAGHNVAVDKPFAASVEEAERMIAAAEKAGKVLTCFQNRRWDSDFLTLKDLMARGVLGDIHHIRSTFSFFKPKPPDAWQNQTLPAVGIHFDLGTHLLDQLVHLFGMPDWVEGELVRRRPASGVPDRLHARLGYPGLRAEAEADMFSPEYAPRFVVQGTKAGWRKDHMDCQEAQLKGGMTATDPGFGVEPEDHYGTLTTYPDGTRTRETVRLLNGTHHAFYRLTREAIENGTEPPVKATETRNVLRVIEAVAQSSEEGKRIQLAP